LFFLIYLSNCSNSIRHKRQWQHGVVDRLGYGHRSRYLHPGRQIPGLSWMWLGYQLTV
jgi:hypothetical protein